MTETIRVNFGKPMPVFPLPDAVLLPHATQHLQIFERRYCQMIADSLDSTGQLAMACYHLNKDADGDTPTVRPAVCIGQITEHKSLGNGMYIIQMHGLCRGRILELNEPTDERLYLTAMLAPSDAPVAQSSAMDVARRRLRGLISGPRLRRMCGADTVLRWFDAENVPTEALLELLGAALVNDPEVKYQLLAEASPEQRARLIQTELSRLDHLVHRAERQPYKDWPKGMSWN